MQELRKANGIYTPYSMRASSRLVGVNVVGMPWYKSDAIVDSTSKGWVIVLLLQSRVHEDHA